MAALSTATGLRFTDATGLRREDFRLICESGFGDPHNNYAHSMAWFQGRLYVGTTRATFASMRINKPLPDFVPWPVECTDVPYDIDRRAQIWAYDPLTSIWEQVYIAPWVWGKNGRWVPRYVSFRGMAVFQGASDSAPCLYVSTWAPIATESPDILRSTDGVEFATAPRPPWDESVRSFRTLQVFKGRVHTTPTGSNRGDGQAQECVGSESTIYATADIAGGHWEPASLDGFGDPTNVTVFELGTFGDRLYAGTVNPKKGFELWRTDGGDTLPYQWTRVLQHGAWRGNHNELALSMCEFNGALYVGSAIVNGGFHRREGIGPAAAELLRVWPDDSWDLLVGQPRHTPDGLKVPLSGFQAGFDNVFAGYIWRMTVHEGWLYVGSFSWANLLPYIPTHAWPSDVLTLLRRWGIEELNRRYGGCALWRTPDGERFELVTRSGFGNKYNWGVRNFASTPHGLFVGTANVFGPRIAAQRDGEWGYTNNPRGGLEIYQGCHAS